MRNRAGTPSSASALARLRLRLRLLVTYWNQMGPERLDRARTVESIVAVPAPVRPRWAGAVLVRYSPRAAGLAAGATVGLPGAPAGGRGELVFPTVDSGGRSVGAGRCNRPCVIGFGIAPARGHPAWTGFQQRLPCAGRIQLVERGADLTTGKRPRHGSCHGGPDPELAASNRGSQHARATPPSYAIRFTP